MILERFRLLHIFVFLVNLKIFLDISPSVTIHQEENINTNFPKPII